LFLFSFVCHNSKGTRQTLWQDVKMARHHKTVAVAKAAGFAQRVMVADLHAPRALSVL